MSVSSNELKTLTQNSPSTPTNILVLGYKSSIIIYPCSSIYSCKLFYLFYLENVSNVLTMFSLCLCTGLKAKPVRETPSHKRQNSKIHAIAQKKTTDRVRTQPDILLVSLVVSVQMKRSCSSSDPVERSGSSCPLGKRCLGASNLRIYLGRKRLAPPPEWSISQ